MIDLVLQFAATVLLAILLAADILVFIYLTSRDGVALVVKEVPKHIKPEGVYEQGLYFIASFILIWELAGVLFSIGSPNSMLTVLLMFVLLGGSLVALKQYDDSRKVILERPQTLFIMAFPISAAEDTELLLSQVRSCVVDVDQPIYSNKVTKTLVELRETLGLDLLHSLQEPK